MQVARWEHFPHGADIGVRGFGATREQAFEQAAVALSAVITEPAGISAGGMVRISCQAPDDELLLVDWLNALVYEMATRRWLFAATRCTSAARCSRREPGAKRWTSHGITRRSRSRARPTRPCAWRRKRMAAGWPNAWWMYEAGHPVCADTIRVPDRQVSLWIYRCSAVIPNTPGRSPRTAPCACRRSSTPTRP